MATLLHFKTAETRSVANGVTVASLIDKQSTEMNVSLIRVERSACYEGQTPSGSDQYLFVLAGEARIDADGKTAAMGPQTFALAEEGTQFVLTGTGAAAAEVLSLVVPPAGAKRATPGFQQGLKVAAVKDLPVVDVPEQKKKRTYLATRDTVGSERGHAQIVRYTGETLTKKHHHPNAESIFVILNGRIQILINGKPEIFVPGQAVHFPMRDSHELCSADGNELSFFECHVPGVFTIKWEE